LGWLWRSCNKEREQEGWCRDAQDVSLA
jgi:hypothetical protein